MDAQDSTYYAKWLHKMAIVFLVVGALNWGLIGCCRLNLVERLLGKGSVLARIIYVLVGISAVSVMFDRDTYLPFLGESVFPCAVLSDQIPPGATRTVTVTVKPGAKVIYWASEPGDSSGDYKEAYRGYQNAGVATAGANGVATLKVREPQGYSVPFMFNKLQPHVHFRVCDATGFVGRIKTIFLADGRVEGFVGY